MTNRNILCAWSTASGTFASIETSKPIFSSAKMQQRNKTRIYRLCVFTGFSIILPLIATIYAKGMRASQPQCQHWADREEETEWEKERKRMLLNMRICLCEYIKYETWSIEQHVRVRERERISENEYEHVDLYTVSVCTCVCDRMEWNGLSIVENAIVRNIWSHYLYIIFYSVALPKCICTSQSVSQPASTYAYTYEWHIQCVEGKTKFPMFAAHFCRDI